MTIHLSAKPEKRANEISLADSAMIAYKNDPAGSKWNIFQAYLKGKFAGEEEKILPIIETEAEKGSSSAQSALGEIFYMELVLPRILERQFYGWKKLSNRGMEEPNIYWEPSWKKRIRKRRCAFISKLFMPA